MKLKMMGNPPFIESSQSSRNWRIDAKFIASQVGPQPMDASPTLEITMPDLRLHFLKRAAPMAMSAEPPTIALLGRIPKGVKKACIEPPRPRLNPLARPNTSANAP